MNGETKPETTTMERESMAKVGRPMELSPVMRRMGGNMNEETTMEPTTMERGSMAKVGRPMELGRVMRRMGTNGNLGRDKLSWIEEIWNRIDEAVHAESQRTKIWRHIIPQYPLPPDAVTVPADTIVRDGGTLAVDEAATIPVFEMWVEFILTLQQVEREEELRTAVTLATGAANLLSQAEDLVIAQGDAAVASHPLFAENMVFTRGRVGTGLLTTDRQTVDVAALPAVPGSTGTAWGANTFAAVAEAYSQLQRGDGVGQAHYGPYALVLPSVPYADTYAPVLTNQAGVADALAVTADRIRPLVTAGYYGTGTLPDFTGILVSLGGNTMDLGSALEPTVAVMQEDTQGRVRCRLVERLAVRKKVQTAAITLTFQQGV
jgi:uncharacterized linocin/CFP29 family protein